MAMARDIRSQLSSEALAGHAGAFYFGATTPDIRVITRSDRRDTHYFDLDTLEHQDSVEAFLGAQGHLADPDRLDAQTVAFVGGYISHLVLDESYIVSMYRPYFGQLSALGGGAQADMMDRLLQYELDRRRREQSADALHIREELSGCSLSLDVGFLDTETLRRWQEVAIDITRQPPTWDRFKFQGGRHLRQAWVDDAEKYEEFLKTVPDLLQQTMDHVSTAQVDAFVEQSKERALRVLERYLACG
jgi:hypothetical protein